MGTWIKSSRSEYDDSKRISKRNKATGCQMEDWEKKLIIDGLKRLLEVCEICE